MTNIVALRALDGSAVSFDADAPAGSGEMKDVYFSPDRSYVVAWFKKPQDYRSVDRLKNIVGPFREKVFGQAGGADLTALYRWPTRVVQADGATGVVVPAYSKEFFFEFGSKDNDSNGLRNREKEGKWFASAHLRQRFLDPRERGTWQQYFSICIKIARAVRRIHAFGLAHSDLSYKNVLVNPRTGSACLIDLDGLVVPGQYPPDVIGTPDFIAPEVMRTQHLDRNDPNRFLPRRETDQHALAVLIYMYLLYRHPLRGRKVHDLDPAVDEELAMGRSALFVEHPTDSSNRPDLKRERLTCLPYADVTKLPFSITGPELSALFERAFVTGLHAPNRRPTADDWEIALIRTVDLLHPCASETCNQKWFVLGSASPLRCPFCGTAIPRHPPILNFYSSDGRGTFRPENHRLVVYSNLRLYRWHASKGIVPNERLDPEARKPAGHFAFHAEKWWFYNQSLLGMKNLGTGHVVPPGSAIELTNDQRLLLDTGAGGRLAHIQLLR